MIKGIAYAIGVIIILTTNSFFWTLIGIGTITVPLLIGNSGPQKKFRKLRRNELYGKLKIK